MKKLKSRQVNLLNQAELNEVKQQTGSKIETRTWISWLPNQCFFRQTTLFSFTVSDDGYICGFTLVSVLEMSYSCLLT